MTLGTDVALNGEGNQRRNLVSGTSPYVTDHSACSPAPCLAWVSRAAFSTPAVGSLGNLDIGNIEGPRIFQFDLALARTFPIAERKNFQLRADAFNLPNHLNPSVPGGATAGANASSAALNAGSFGQITGDISGTSGLTSGDYRIVQVALKFVF